MVLPALEDYSYEEFEELLNAIDVEKNRRANLVYIPAMVKKLTEDYLEAVGQVNGSPWVQPTAAFDSYPKDWQVTHNDKTWDSTVAANVWEPPTNWREVVEEGAAPPDWVQPTGAGDAYSIGDKVTFGGSVYTSTINGNSWSPTDYPAGWEKAV